jgi:rhodanese-related sulfurtransferase
MKIIVISLGILAAIIVGFFALSKPAAQQTVVTESSNEEVKKVTFQTIKEDVTAGAAFIDVRTAEEFAEGHIEGAQLLPLASLEAGKRPDVAKDEKVYLYCRSGNRSAEAKQVLEKAGYTNVVDLGAYSDVVALGGKMVK